MSTQVGNAEREGGFWESTRDVPAWAISLSIHLALLLALGMLTHTTFVREAPLITSVIEDLDPESFEFSPMTVDEIGNDSNIHQNASSLAAASKIGNDPQKEMQRDLEEQHLTMYVPPTEEILEPNEAELLDSVETKGASETVGGTEGALDRITHEIAASLRERKTLVIWLFDVSPSVSKRREEIADRFENVYRQLDALKATKNRALKTAVASFGANLNYLTEKPVDDVTNLVKSVRAIEPDSTGDENVFSAVTFVSRRWKSYRTGAVGARRNIMVVVVTDEAGTDQNKLEEAIQTTRRFGIRCYVVGNAAPFGRKLMTIPWEIEPGITVPAEFEPGPESAQPERVQLPFWGGRNNDLKKMSSGFGPYGLTRLCAESGGMYFIAEDTSGPRFDSASMRAYRPDYISMRDYAKELSDNSAKKSLVDLAVMSWDKTIPTPQLGFRAENDGVLRQQLDAAQRPFAELDYQLRQFEAVAMQGENGRGTLKEPRWRAGFDLAVARILALRVRAYGYNSFLADMKVSPKTFEKAGSNYWRLVPAREIAGGNVRKLQKRAIELLKRVINEHPGTPWALIAERELGQPMGWRWQEAKINIPRPGGGNRPNRPNIQLAPDNNPNPQNRQQNNRPPLPKKIKI